MDGQGQDGIPHRQGAARARSWRHRGDPRWHRARGLVPRGHRGGRHIRTAARGFFGRRRADLAEREKLRKWAGVSESGPIPMPKERGRGPDWTRLTQNRNAAPRHRLNICRLFGLYWGRLALQSDATEGGHHGMNWSRLEPRAGACFARHWHINTNLCPKIARLYDVPMLHVGGATAKIWASDEAAKTLDAGLAGAVELRRGEVRRNDAD